MENKPLNPRILEPYDEAGMAMLLTLLFLALLTLTASASLYLGYIQKSFARSSVQESQAAYLAESGIEQILHWFKHPETFRVTNHFRNGYTGDASRFFTMRLQDNTSFFNESGQSQFQGTLTLPDLLLTLPEDDNPLNDPSSGIFRSIQDAGKIAFLSVTKPSTPGALCTIQSTGLSGKMRRTVRVELSADPITPIPGTWWEE